MTTAHPVPRDPATRLRETLARLTAEEDVWLATAHPRHGPHQIPIWFLWRDDLAWLCTRATSPSVRNIRADPRVRLALPSAADVVIVDGSAEPVPLAEGPAAAYTAKYRWDPAAEADTHLFLRVVPRTVLAWRGEPEFPGRSLMRRGTWLA
ncbi:pyridoxamine 5'-phosphate oxidase [Mangrovactinospora gilvigrisea]|uniref:Pyridoxamine 5'-phosphate oxidase n=1 Tax=Mangrovactinospora gilvigrisea TaxID=1428644 RepID=A0A1J7BDI7_9ACTN|nr:pyridoxamine 5'-phosphate oxidase family protein [Mangrovactinospora gilvigrisea]OIV36743.1 pyridoxamine 5'-phosphate oxidase [Mangrovactinospora gilvigrisea]